jgi:hypothetical protein
MAKLEQRDDAGGPRLYLDGRALHCGEAVEVLSVMDRWSTDGRRVVGTEEHWVRVRYEVDWSTGGPYHVFFLSSPSGHPEGLGSMRVARPELVEARWPAAVKA